VLEFGKGHWDFGFWILDFGLKIKDFGLTYCFKGRLEHCFDFADETSRILIHNPQSAIYNQIGFIF
jgi:hypothetical protein